MGTHWNPDCELASLSRGVKPTDLIIEDQLSEGQPSRLISEYCRLIPLTKYVGSRIYPHVPSNLSPLGQRRLLQTTAAKAPQKWGSKRRRAVESTLVNTSIARAY